MNNQVSEVFLTNSQADWNAGVQAAERGADGVGRTFLASRRAPDRRPVERGRLGRTARDLFGALE